MVDTPRWSRKRRCSRSTWTSRSIPFAPTIKSTDLPQRSFPFLAGSLLPHHRNSRNCFTFRRTGALVSTSSARRKRKNTRRNFCAALWRKSTSADIEGPNEIHSTVWNRPPVPYDQRGVDICIGTVRIGKARDLSRACSLRERTSDSEARRSHETLGALVYIALS